MESKSTSTGLAPNVAAGVAYLFGFISGVVFYLIEKEDRFVRFAAVQSIALNVAWIVLLFAVMIAGAIIAFIPVIGGLLGILISLLSFVIWIGGFVLWLVCMVKAFQGATYKIPYLGDIAEKYV